MSDPNSLTVYGQQNGTGTLYTDKNSVMENAGIGGSADEGKRNCGTVTINGGAINAKARHGAGIGGGGGTSGTAGSGGKITINGGVVFADSEYAAGIGGGYASNNGDDFGSAGTIAINGGVVTAQADGYFGIGGKGGSVCISGGLVTAYCADIDRGIGGGCALKTQEDGAASGNAVVFAKTISDQSNKSSWSGVIIEGVSDGSGFVVARAANGDPTVTVESDKTLSNVNVGANATVVIPSSSALTIKEGGTLANSGAVYVDGTLTGEVESSGNGAVYYPLMLVDASATGDISTPEEGKTYGKAGGTVTLAPVDKSGYTFGDWVVSTSGAKIEGNKYRITMPSAAVAATSKWVSRITFDANEGSCSTSSADVPEGSTYTAAGIALPTPSREGYAFVGWFTAKTDGTQVTDASVPTGNAMLYAHWTPNTNTPYVVNHWQQNINGGDERNDTNFTLVAGDTENLTGTTDSEVTPAVKSYIGFTAPNTQTVSIAADGKTVVNYYYTRDSYTVTLNSNEGTINSGNVSSYTYGVGATLPTDVTKTGYTFAGWYSDGAFSGDLVTTISTSDAGIKAYWAKWTVNQYTITFESNGGTTINPITQDYGTALSLPTPAKENYDFGGWYSDSGLTAQYTGTTMPAADTKLYAKWTAKQYNVTLDANGGTINSGNITSYTYGTGATLPTDVTKSGNTFAGWYDGNNQKVAEIAADSTGDVALAAKWYAIYVPPTYTVPVTGEGSVAVKATVSGSTAVVGEISVEALEGAVAGGEGGEAVSTVTIDLSGMPQGVTQAQLFKSTVENLLAVVSDAGNAVESVTVELGGAAVVVDAEALAAIAGQAKGGSVTIGVRETKGEALNGAQEQALSGYEVVELYFEAEVRSGGAEIHDFGGGTVRVSVAFAPRAGHDPMRYVVLYVGDDGQLERYATAWADGMLSFTAPHFSAYAVVYVEDATQAAIDALEAVPDAGELKLDGAEVAVAQAQTALDALSKLDAGQRSLVDV
ncbi:MAG: InlB B-repeat-containing protein, partial [Coriobacteriales bacterium]